MRQIKCESVIWLLTNQIPINILTYAYRLCIKSVALIKESDIQNAVISSAKYIHKNNDNII